VAMLRAKGAAQTAADELKGDERTGALIVFKALESPIRQILENAGEDPMTIMTRILNEGSASYGFDAATSTYVDMIVAGIIDPTKVTRSALQNAASIAGLMLTTQCLVADLPEERTDGQR
jgi:chaperonin GroEL